MITGIYGGLLALLCVCLSLHVIKLRWKHKVSLGDGGVDELQQAIAAQNNAMQYIPIAIILSYILESQQLNIYVIHIAGITLLIGRLIHAISIIKSEIKLRKFGMQLTFCVIITLAMLVIILPLFQLVVS